VVKKMEEKNEKDERLESLEGKRVPCEVYSRVVGYIRPVSQWNEGKQEEFAERHVFSESSEGKGGAQPPCGCKGDAKK
jgi:hypothetical protein